MAEERNVKGLAELQKLLDTLPAKVEANVMRGALRAGAKPIQQAAIDKAPVQSGDLRRSIRVTTKRSRGVVYANVVAGGRNRKTGRDIYYAHIVEFTGAKPHTIRARRTESLRIGGQFAGGSVLHPGFQPRPFMRPALESQSSQAVAATAQYVKQRLTTKEGLNASHIRVEGDDE